MVNTDNDVPAKLKELRKYFSEKYPEAVVLIDNAQTDDHNTLLVTVSGDDQDEVAKLATTTIASEVRNHPLARELEVQESVSATIVNDEESFYEYEVAARVWQ